MSRVLPEKQKNVYIGYTTTTLPHRLTHPTSKNSVTK